jgi:exosortase D (VPLPA-CTERM-specific)
MGATEETVAMSEPGGAQPVWRAQVLTWGLLGLAVAVALFVFWTGVDNMMGKWETPEYSHGYLIPLVAAFLIWQRKDELERLALPAAWSGFAVVLLGLFLFLAGDLATLYVVVQYAFLVVVVGLALATVGWAGVKRLWAPLLILFFMVPLPNFLYNNLSAQLQLISSEWGTAVIRALGISVNLEGNVIDLGAMKLQVVEACNGLRYLFPLTTVGFIVAYFYEAPFWKRAVVFLSAIPITVVMNSLRIAVTGVLVDRYGTAHAEGFLHDFEGWVVFMAAFGVMLALMWLLNLIGPDRRPFRDAFGVTFPAPTPAGAEVRRRPVPRPLIASAAVLAAAAIGAQTLPERSELVPPRADFLDFPLQIGDWQGRRDTMEIEYIDALKFTDYVMVDYQRGGADPVNFYVAYYESQRKGESAHSPRSCIPGGGWEISAIREHPVAGATVNGQPLVVNRTQIAKGDFKQLVYYWFQQRGRVITNEYLVKWYLFWDALTRNRSDGALVRLTTMLRPGEAWEIADARLEAFAREVEGQLPRYVPN